MKMPEPVAWLHDVVGGDREPDQALSFSPDSFPLQGVGGFESVGNTPLYTAEQLQAAYRAAIEDAAKVCDKRIEYADARARCEDATATRRIDRAQWEGITMRECAAAIRGLTE